MNSTVSASYHLGFYGGAAFYQTDEDVAAYFEALDMMTTEDWQIHHYKHIPHSIRSIAFLWSHTLSNRMSLSVADYRLMKRLARLPKMSMVAKLIALQFDGRN